MAVFSGLWTVPTLEGERTLVVDGMEFAIPRKCAVKLVTAGRLEVAHVLVGDRVYLLAAQGQLVESESESRSRATPSNWSLVRG